MDGDMVKSNQPHEGLWTVERVAEFLEMHPQTVYAKSRLGEIPSIKIGRSLRFRPEDVRAWVDEQAKATQEPTRTPEEQDAWEKVRAEEVAKRRAG